MLKSLFEPEGVVVIGASRDPEKVGHSILKNIIYYGYKGGIYPVNPNAKEILGMRVYPSVTTINHPCELAIVAVPARIVPQTLRECSKKGIKVAVIISAGFKEAGQQGMALEREILEIARSSGMRLLGPNCLGVINTFSSLNATFADGMPQMGKISLFSQSGALGVAILDWALQNRLGFSKFISLGNKADLCEIDFIEYFMEDPTTDVILGYIEDVVDGQKFIKVASRCTKKKPIILIKSGSTGAGARAASSHTGALAGSEAAFNAAFRQCGVIRAWGVRELFELAKVFLPARLPKDRNVVVVTNAGGPGIIAADEAERAGLNLRPTPEKIVKKLRKILPEHASLYNPIDILGDATSERYAQVLELLSSSKDFSCIVIILTPQAMTDVDRIADNVIQLHKKTKKTVVSVFMGGGKVSKAVERFKKEDIPTYAYPEEAMSCIKQLVSYTEYRRKPSSRIVRYKVKHSPVKEIIRQVRAESRQILTEYEARAILKAYGIKFPKTAFVREPEEAVRQAQNIGYPLVMKVVSPDVLHKTDVGGVMLNIKDANQLKDAYYSILSNIKLKVPQAEIKGFLISEMITEGIEVIVGLTYDRSFGHLLMFGLGGIYVELLKDVSFRVVPASKDDIIGMIHEIKTYPLLTGARGKAAVDINTIVEVIARVNQLAIEFPEIQELDINPLMVTEQAAVALDARVILSGKG